VVLSWTGFNALLAALTLWLLHTYKVFPDIMEEVDRCL
jgi:hypothetical protein